MNSTLISIFAGVLSMFGWGSADVIAAPAIRKLGNLSSLLFVKLSGLAVVFIVILLAKENFNFSLADLALTIVAGFAMVAGYFLFYRAITVGKVSIVAPILSTQSIFVILISFFVFDQQLVRLQAPGVILILIGASLLSVNLNEFRLTSKLNLFAGVKESLLAALLFGFIYVPINVAVTSHASWMWFLLIVKAVSVVAVLIALRKFKPPQKPDLIRLGITGVFDVGALIIFTIGLTIGAAILVSPISQGQGLVAVALSWIFLKEKLTGMQLIGAVGIVIGIIMTGL